MSASKSSAKKWTAQSQYQLDDFNEIDRFQRICFPKTPKTPPKKSTSQLFVLASNGKSNNNNNYNNITYNNTNTNNDGSFKLQDLLDNSQSPLSHSQHLRRRSYDGTAGIFSREGRTRSQDTIQDHPSAFKVPQQSNQLNESQISSLPGLSQVLRSHLPQQQPQQKQQQHQHQQQQPSEHSQTIAIPAYVRITPSRTSQKLLQQDYFEPQIVYPSSAFSVVMQPLQGGVRAPSVIGDVVEFIRRVGCELNDLCLTKMSEKSLQTLVEKHITSVVNVQRAFSDAVESEPNISIGLRVISDCLSDLVEKLNDLITRLRMFNKQKFKNLVEQSLSNTLKEIFEESNRLSFLEIVTDINVFVSTQRKTLFLTKFARSLDRIALKNLRHAFLGIRNAAGETKQDMQNRKDRITGILKQILINTDARSTTQVSKFFRQWHYMKQSIKDRSNRIFEGTAYLRSIVDTTNHQNALAAFQSIKHRYEQSCYRDQVISRFVATLQVNLNHSSLSWFSQLKNSCFAHKITWNRSILRVKGKAVANVLTALFRQQKASAMHTLTTANAKVSQISQGLTKMDSLLAQTFKEMTIRALTTMIGNSRMESMRLHLGSTAIATTLKKLLNKRLQSTLSTLKTHRIKSTEVFQCILREVNNLPNPSLRHVLKAADTCFMSRRLSKIPTNIRSCIFRTINLADRQGLSLDPSTKRLQVSYLHPDVVFAVQQAVNEELANDEETSNATNTNGTAVTYSIPQLIADESEINLPSSREPRVYNSLFIELDHLPQEKIYLVCETVSAHWLSSKISSKISKLLVTMRNRLKESYSREHLHLSMCSNIQGQHQRINLNQFFSQWKQHSNEKELSEQDAIEAEKTRDLEKQLLSYKIEIEKSRVHSSNIMKELGVKKEEIHEIESRLSDLTIEKKAKAKCLATALFANYMESKTTRVEQLRRGFSKWSSLLTSKKLAQLACEQIQDMNIRHVDTRFSAAAHLITHFSQRYINKLQTDALKALAYNAVCLNNTQNNTSMLNFSQLHAAPTSLNRSPIATPTRSLSPNLLQHGIKQSVSTTSLTTPNIVVNFNETGVSQQKQQQQQQQQNNNYPRINLNNSRRTSSSHMDNLMLTPPEQSPPIQRVESEIQIINNSQISNNNIMRTSIASIMRSSVTQPAEQQQQHLQEQPALFLQPTHIVNPLLSSTSTTSKQHQQQQQLLPTQLQPLSMSYNNGINDTQQPLNSSYSIQSTSLQKQYHNQQQQRRTSANSLHSSYNQTLRIDQQENAMSMNTPSASKSQHHTPSNLGYRLSAKTINFLQKFGRGSTTAGASATSSSSKQSELYHDQQYQYLQQQQQPLQNSYRNRNVSPYNDEDQIQHISQNNRRNSHESSFYKRH